MATDQRDRARGDAPRRRAGRAAVGEAPTPTPTSARVVLDRGGRGRRRGLPPAGRRPARRGRALCRRRRPGPRRHRRRHARAVRPHRPHRAVRRGLHRRRRARVVVRGRRPDPGGARRRRDCCARRASTSRPGCSPTRPRPANERWLTARAAADGRSCVWKVAATLDGRVAAADGTSRWISSPESRADAHRLRAECDAIVAGIGHGAGRRPGADRARRRRALVATSRCGWSSTPTAVRRPARGSATRPRRPGSRPPPSCGADAARPRRPRRPAARRCTAAATGSCCSRAGPTLAGAFLRDGLVDEVVAYLATDPARRRPRGARRHRRRDARRRAARSTSSTSTRAVPTCASRPAPRRAPSPGGGLSVHRHHRGARRGGRDRRTRATASRLALRGPAVTSDAPAGDSIAVNGVCLTVVEQRTTASSPPT